MEIRYSILALLLLTSQLCSAAPAEKSAGSHEKSLRGNGTDHCKSTGTDYGLVNFHAEFKRGSGRQVVYEGFAEFDKSYDEGGSRIHPATLELNLNSTGHWIAEMRWLFSKGKNGAPDSFLVVKKDIGPVVGTTLVIDGDEEFVEGSAPATGHGSVGIGKFSFHMLD